MNIGIIAHNSKKTLIEDFVLRIKGFWENMKYTQRALPAAELRKLLI